MPKRLLILTDGFGRPLYCPRIAQLSHNLLKEDWEVTILTEQLVGEDYTVPRCRFVAMPYYNGHKLHDWIWRMGSILLNLKDRQLYHTAQRYIDLHDYDLILASTFNLFPLPAAARLAKQSGLPLVIDLRDITEQWNGYSYLAHPVSRCKWINRAIIRLYEKHIIQQRNQILLQAQALTTISPWHQSILSTLHPHVQLIYNGFDTEDYAPRVVPTNRFIISYTGRLYDMASRNPMIFLDALNQLVQERAIAQEHLEVIFHVEPTLIDDIRHEVRQRELQTIVSINGYIPRDQARDLLHRSSISLIFLAKETDSSPRGIMTTKFFEALGAERPVLCSPLQQGVLADAIAYTHAGLASDNTDDIKEYILTLYHEWLDKGYTHADVCHREEFSRQTQAQQFIALFMSLTTEHS